MHIGTYLFKIQIHPNPECTRVARWFINKPKIHVGYILEGFGIDNVGILCGHLVHFPLFWYVVPGKIWQPWSELKTHVCILDFANICLRVRFFSIQYTKMWKKIQMTSKFTNLL
jgi:hypothetical protein